MRKVRLFAPGAVAVVTGAAGGLGTAIVDTFASAGCRVLAVDISRDGLQRLADMHPGISTLVVDLTADHAPSEVVRAAMRTYGGLRILVNSAGITRHGSALEFPGHEWDRVMDINLRVPFLLSQASARVMSGGGSIVNIGSIGGRTANPNNVPYGVSKTALLGLTMHLALEWGPLGIRVNAVNPGMTTSSMHGLVVPDAMKDAQAKLVPLRRLPDPLDVADAVAFLASDHARSITGAALDVDGGYLLSLMSTLPRGEMRGTRSAGTLTQRNEVAWPAFMLPQLHVCVRARLRCPLRTISRRSRRSARPPVGGAHDPTSEGPVRSRPFGIVAAQSCGSGTLCRSATTCTARNFE